jgi:hypothetical protein
MSVTSCPSKDALPLEAVILTNEGAGNQSAVALLNLELSIRPVFGARSESL